MSDAYDGRDQTQIDMLEDVEDGKGDETPAPAKGVRLKRGEAETLKKRMKVAIKYRDTKFMPWYKEVMRMQRGEHYADAQDHQVVVNMMPHVIETQVYSTTFNHGDLIAQPKDQIGAENLDVAQHATDCEMKQAHALRENRRAYKDSRMFNFGLVYTGWRWRTEDVDYTDGRQQVEGEEPEPEAVLRAVEEGRELPPPVPRAKVLDDNFYVKRIDPRLWLISPESSWVMEDVPWCGMIEYVDVADVKADPRYKNTAQLKGSCEHLEGYLGDDEKEAQSELHTDLRRVELWHYYERKRRLHVVFAKESEKPLLVEKWHWEHDQYPFVPVFAEPGEDGWYQIPPPLVWKHCQQEINNFHTQLAIHIRRFVRKYVAREQDFTEANKRKIMSGVDGTVIETKAQNAAGALVPVVDAQLSPDLYNSERSAMEYLGRISALDQYSLGRPPTKRLTQDEAQSIAGAGGARQQAARAAFEELTAKVAEHCLALNQQYAMRTRSYPVYVDGKIAQWKDWTAEEIRGQYQFEVYVGSTELKNKASIAEEMGFLIQALQPFFAPDPQTGQMVADPKPLLRQLLAAVPEIKDVAAIIPMDQEMPPAPPGMEGGNPLDQLAAMMGGPAPPGMEEMGPPPDPAMDPMMGGY